MKQISSRVEHHKLHNVFFYPVHTITPLAEDVSRILLAPKLSSLSYQAGQYAKVMHEMHDASPLSIACAPNQQLTIEFHLYHPLENQRAQDILRMCHIEKTLRLIGPFGTCTAQRLNLKQPIIFLAYGTGFAPIKAVIEEIARTNHHPIIYCYWVVNKEEDLYLAELIKEWASHFADFIFYPIYVQTFSEPAWQKILSQHADFSHQQIYASGPRIAIERAFDAFVKRGLIRERFHSDVCPHPNPHLQAGEGEKTI